MIVVGLVVVCLSIYLQVLWFDFINLDDNLYVYDNPFVRPGLHLVSVQWALTTFHAANWHPLTWVSHMLDAELFGPNAGGHHLVSVLIHAANTILAYFVFKRLTGEVWKSALVALLFAVHPTHVESVAWVAERKDVLSTLFWLLTMFAYIVWTRRSADDGTSGWRKYLTGQYALVLLAFVLGLMSKPMLVTLPFVLLLLDYWPLARLRTLGDLAPRFLEKTPLFVLSAVSSFLTLKAQAASGAVVSTTTLPYASRFANAIVAYAKYVVMLFYPADLAIGYSYPGGFEFWRLAGSLIILTAITYVCIRFRDSRPYLIVGWLWFVGTLVPVIGIVQVGAQSMADRYTYIPYFGLFIMVVWAAADEVSRLRVNSTRVTIAVILPLLALSLAAYSQASYWSNSIRLYTRSIETGNGNFLVRYNLCKVLIEQRRLTDAEAQCLAAIESDPRIVDPYNLLGMVYLLTNRNSQAIDAFKKVIAVHPNDPVANGNIAVPLMIAGDTEGAEQSLDKTVAQYRSGGLSPAHFATSYANLANVLAEKKAYSRAADVFRKSIDLDPGRADLHVGLARMLLYQDRVDDAREEINRAIEMGPDQAEAQNALGMILLKQGDRAGAIAAFERAVKMRPDLEEAKQNLENAKKAG